MLNYRLNHCSYLSHFAFSFELPLLREAPGLGSLMDFLLRHQLVHLFPGRMLSYVNMQETEKWFTRGTLDPQEQVQGPVVFIWPSSDAPDHLPSFEQRWSSTDNSAPSEARKRGSGGGSPRKYDDLLTGPPMLVKTAESYSCRAQ